MRAITLLLLFLAASALAQTDPWSKVAADLSSTGVCRIRLQRSDLQIQNAAGMLLPPEMGLTSEVLFQGSVEATVTGDICLVRQEVDDVIDDLRAGGIEIVSLGNRFSGEQPNVYFLHFQGRGGLSTLLPASKKAFLELGKDRLVSEGLQRTGSAPVVDWPSVSTILGKDVISLGAAHVMHAALEKDTWVNFGGCPCGRTMVFGAVRTAPGNLQRAIDAIRRGKLTLSSLGSEGLYFEGEGEAKTLANAIRQVWNALD